MDRHLNIFRPFSHNQAKEHIEDNISRAFVLCLQNSQVLLHKFIKGVISSEDYDYLFNNFNPNANFFIDIQVNLLKVDSTAYKSIYAIALTSQELEMLGFFDVYSFKQLENYRPETDIFINLNDVLIIIEVKRHGEDCRQQLYNQIHQLLLNSGTIPSDVIVKSISWLSVMEQVYKAYNFEKYTNNNQPFLHDFLGLIRQYRSSWLPVTPFASLPEDEIYNQQRLLRLQAAIEAIENVNLVEKGNRIGLQFPLSWSDEVIYSFREDNTLAIAIYPGNTKSQGYSFYAKNNQNWRNVNEVEINGEKFKTSITSHIKFSGQGYITGLWFSNNDEKKPICVKENFHLTGRKYKETWDDLASFFDKSFKEEYKWKEKCDWNKKIKESNRTRFDLSFGYEVAILIPYKYLQSIDKTTQDIDKLSVFLKEIFNKFLSLLEWKKI